MYALPLMYWNMAVTAQLQMTEMFFSMAFGMYGRPRPKLQLVAHNPWLTRTERRATLTVVR